MVRDRSLWSFEPDRDFSERELSGGKNELNRDSSWIAIRGEDWRLSSLINGRAVEEMHKTA